MHNRTFHLIILLLIAVIALAACGSDDDNNTNSPNTAQNNPPVTYTTLTVEAAHKQASADPNAIIVDVREPSEWEATGVPAGARLISLNTLTSVQSGAVNGLPQDKNVYVICNSGNRSRVASEHLIALGYQTVYNVDGGIQAWIDADLPTQPYTR